MCWNCVTSTLSNKECSSSSSMMLNAPGNCDIAVLLKYRNVLQFLFQFQFAVSASRVRWQPNNVAVCTTGKRQSRQLGVILASTVSKSRFTLERHDMTCRQLSHNKPVGPRPVPWVCYAVPRVSRWQSLFAVATTYLGWLFATLQCRPSKRNTEPKITKFNVLNVSFGRQKIVFMAS